MAAPVATSSVQAASVGTKSPEAAPPAAESEPAPVVAEAPAAPPAPTIKAAEPATLQQAIKAIDLGKLPLPEGAVAGEARPTELSFNSPGTIAAAYESARAKLLALGCRELTEGNIKQMGDVRTADQPSPLAPG